MASPWASVWSELSGHAAFISRVGRLGGAVQGAALKAMGVVGRELERFVKAEELSGQLLNYRRGNLRRAIFHEVGTDGAGDAFARVGADLKKAPYARVQELGGVIRPKNGRYLTIPLGQAMTASGVGRFTARQLIERPQSFGYVGTFVRNHVIFGKTSDGGIVPLFALKEQVTIKPVGYLRAAAVEKRDWVQKTVSDAVEKAFREQLDGK